MADDQDHRNGTPEQEAAVDAPGDQAEAAGGDAEARLLAAEARAEQFRDQALRAQAEAENVRRRAARDVENAHKFALERFSGELLPVLDSLEKAVEVASATEGAEAIAEGVNLSLKLFLSVLEKQGIERVDPAGEPFDPQRHEAMAMVPSPTAEPNSVIEVMQPGYLLNGRLVRAAKVVVARGGDEPGK
jgi:molecular chaperone GrpE